MDGSTEPTNDQWLRKLFGDKWPKTLHRYQKIACAPGCILITGETGTGKSRLATWLHHLSPQASEPLAICGAGELDTETFDATLFGHTRNAFTGAQQESPGLLAHCDKGTLILDDIDYLPLRMQAKLLRVVQDGKYSRLGEAHIERQTHARFVFTSNKDLKQLMEKQQFLPDLYYRIQRWKIHMLPLREQRDGCAQLVEHIWSQSHAAHLPSESAQILSSFQWPGNLRELQDALAQLSVFLPDDCTEVSPLLLINTLMEDLKDGQPLLRHHDRQRQPCEEEKQQIIKYLRQFGQVQLVANLFGRSRNTIYKIANETGFDAD